MSTATPSLRRRVTATVLVLFAVLLVLVVVLVDLALGGQLRRDLDTRLADRVAQAQRLIEQGATPSDLVAQLQGQDIRVRVVTTDGQGYGDPGLGPAAGAAIPGGPPDVVAQLGSSGSTTAVASPAMRPAATSTTVERALPDGTQLLLVGDTTAITQVREQLRAVLGVSALVALLLAGVALAVTVGTALRPLDRMTALARRITAGDRGSRLVPDRPGTDLGLAAAAFDDMLDALERAESRARGAADRTHRFLSDAAHELRTPLAGIQALAETITRSDLAADVASGEAGQRRQRRARLLLHETGQATRLVTDMLDLARIDDGVALQRTRTDLAELVAAEADRVRTFAPALHVTVTGPRVLPAVADPGRVSQILANLLDNARRHTPPAGHLGIDVASMPGRAVVTITNDGPPIAAADRERIFDRLVRLQDARSRDTGGAGLGLAIARGLARAHGGDLTCLPVPTGAAFRLTLPI
ncbi:HAMP domain-containing sensor histidine kinase [Pseudonocardia sp. GCM10023141]|uniref:HAMP domain-containing sensor histidine kinase n=1 Tax=Pseudonocardia sp. GCM10023141 TaxID=3252653 RepID=UPI00360AA613